MGSRTQPSLRRLAGRLAEMPRRQQPPSVQLPLHGGVPFARRRLRVRRGGSANRVGRAWRGIRGACKLVPVFQSSFPRRQQARRLRRAAASGAAAIVGRRAGGDRRWRRRYRAGWIAGAGDGRAGARRSSLGAPGRSQPRRRAVRGRGASSAQRAGGGGVAAASLAPVGWARGYRQRRDRARRGSRSRSRSKTRTFDARHLDHARQTAAWLYRHRRRWCRRGALPVLCVVRARGVEHVEDEVLVVSLDRLAPALRAGAGTSPRPRFLAPQTSSC